MAFERRLDNDGALAPMGDVLDSNGPSDAMLGEVYAAISATARGGWLCAYGDHVPILPSIYKANGFVDGRTDYLVVGTGSAEAPGQNLDIAAEELALSLLRDAGCA